MFRNVHVMWYFTYNLFFGFIMQSTEIAVLEIAKEACRDCLEDLGYENLRDRHVG